MKGMRKNLHDSKKEEITDELHLAGLGHEIIRYVKPRIHTHTHVLWVSQVLPESWKARFTKQPILNPSTCWSKGIQENIRHNACI